MLEEAFEGAPPIGDTPIRRYPWTGGRWAPARFGPVPVFGAIAGVGWHFSTVLLRPDRTVLYPERLVSVRDGRAWFVRTRWTEQPGRWAVRWPGGQVEVGPPLENTAGSPVGSWEGPEPGSRPARPLRPPYSDLVCREWPADRAAPPDGTRVGFDCVLYDSDPAVHGLEFTEISVPGPLGPYPAWLVPAAPDRGPAGSVVAGLDVEGLDAAAASEGAGLDVAGHSDTWVIAVHGRGMDRRECLRVLPALHRLGFPVLAISYRNDVGAPASPDGYYHLGDTEWLDLEAAVTCAVGAGARRVVLYGWSMGAAIGGAFLSRSALADRVVAVVWDCPMLDWWATLRRQAALRRLPPALIRVVAAFTRTRAGIDLNRFDLRRRPPTRRPPTLMFHGELDSTVPAGPARALAAAAPALSWPLRYIEVPGAEHTATWNADPESYERALAELLRPHTPTCTPAQPAQWHDGARD